MALSIFHLARSPVRREFCRAREDGGAVSRLPELCIILVVAAATVFWTLYYGTDTPPISAEPPGKITQ